jgi:hypothetical protein
LLRRRGVPATIEDAPTQIAGKAFYDVLIVLDQIAAPRAGGTFLGSHCEITRHHKGKPQCKHQPSVGTL